MRQILSDNNPNLALLKLPLKEESAKERLKSRWGEFIVDGKGSKCVEEEPWVTVAESSELAVALMVNGQKEKAKMVFDWLHQWRGELVLIEHVANGPIE